MLTSQTDLPYAQFINAKNGDSEAEIEKNENTLFSSVNK